MSRTPNVVRTAQTRDQILDAATELIRRMGPARMTMEAVAGEARVSKGGVLHHFPSKDALVTALAARVLEKLREGFAAEQAQLPPGGRDAVVRPMARHARSTCEDEGGFPRALMLAAFEQPEALEGFRSFMAEQVAAIRSGAAEPGRPLIGLFAVIGLLLSRNLGFCALNDAEIVQLLELVETLE